MSQEQRDSKDRTLQHPMLESHSYSESSGSRWTTGAANFIKAPAQYVEGLNTGRRLYACISIPDLECLGHMNNERKHEPFGGVMHNFNVCMCVWFLLSD